METDEMAARKTRLIFQALILTGVAALLAACQTQPIPLSAQIGSTIVIPLTPEIDHPSVKLGYGGTEYADVQRGELVYQLVGTNPLVELKTRFTVATSPHPASVMAGEKQVSFSTNTQAHPVQVLSVVDIWPRGLAYDPANPPANFPEGTYSLDVVLRRPNLPDIPGPAFHGQIRILPASITVNGPSGPEDIVGAPTPTKAYACTPGCGYMDISVLKRMIPRPRIKVDLGNLPIAAFELQLSHAPTLQIVDAYQEASLDRAPNDAPFVWLNDDGNGNVTIGGISHPDDASNPARWGLQVVFELVGGAPPLDLASGDVQLGAVSAYDANGDAIAVTPALLAIR